MTFEQLKAEHPKAHNDLMSANGDNEARARENWAALKARAFEEGVLEERARIVALLRLGEASGALDLAIEAVNNDSTVEEMKERFLEAALERGGSYRYATTAAIAKLRGKSEVG
jgi:uncharacterized Fe-S cluster-containing protein